MTKDHSYNIDTNIFLLQVYMQQIFPDYPKQDLLWERLTEGIKIIGSLEGMGFWPPDQKRTHKAFESEENLTMPFTKKNLEKVK